MSELRELLRRVERIGGKQLSPEAYALLEAVVNELEAQRPPEVDARIITLTDERGSWERQCRNAERGLAEAKVGTERMRTRRNYWIERSHKSEDELAEAKADVEQRLEHIRDIGAQNTILRAKLRDALAEIERLRPLAEIGQLVRGMPDETALRRIVGTYRIARFGYIEPRRLGWKSDAGYTEDPAEALRSIQASE